MITAEKTKTDSTPCPSISPDLKPLRSARVGKREASRDDFHFVTVLPDGTEANMDDPAVCRALGVWIEYASRGMAVPTEVVQQAYGEQSHGMVEPAATERMEASCG